MNRILPLVLLIGASTAAAQQASVIRAGMTEAEVRAAFGAPAVVRHSGSRSYLFYTNGCPVRCGSDDVVFLENGRVAMAVLRSPARRISGPGVQGSRPGPAGTEPGAGVELRLPGTRGVSVGRAPSRRIVVGPRTGEAQTQADGYAVRRPAVTDTIRGPLQRADTAAALRPPAPVPGTPPADTVTVRPRPPRP